MEKAENYDVKKCRDLVKKITVVKEYKEGKKFITVKYEDYDFHEALEYFFKNIKLTKKGYHYKEMDTELIMCKKRFEKIYMGCLPSKMKAIIKNTMIVSD